ncbi:MAG: hypothetical protein LBL26_07035 [Peptococcaceae bacterium]|jgi:hypothetical protein|nr:hypothetical protein [Peptococcaceae bacterium]
MQTYQGYIENGRIVPIDMPRELNGLRVVITVLEPAAISGKKRACRTEPEPGTLEYLFRDYDGTSFQTELANLGAPAGNEKW